MKNLLKFLLLAFILSFYQLSFAQSYKIGTIDVYGNRRTDVNTVIGKLNLKVGDTINHDSFKPEELAEKLRQIPAVKYATVNPVCCDTANNLMLFIGVGETDSVILKYRKAPAKKIRLPAEMIAAYKNKEDQLEAAIKSGQAYEDDSNGYALIVYKPARNEQEKFIHFVNTDFSLLANVLKNSVYAADRAAAAEIIAYSLERQTVADHLLYAINDPDDEVRNNATRALGVLAAYLTLHPDLKITIPVAPFIKMMNSIVWTDRNKGAMVLMQLTQSRDENLLHEIKQQALPSIIEMAKWKDRNHTLSSFVLLGRIADIDEQTLISKNYALDWAAEIKVMIDKCCRQ
jgi:POTRA domain, FtsQ-type